MTKRMAENDNQKNIRKNRAQNGTGHSMNEKKLQRIKYKKKIRMETRKITSEEILINQHDGRLNFCFRRRGGR